MTRPSEKDRQAKRLASAQRENPADPLLCPPRVSPSEGFVAAGAEHPAPDGALSEAGESVGMMDRLRKGDPKSVNDVVVELHPGLYEYARRELSRGGIHSRDAETLVDSVLIRCLGVAANRCPDDRALRGFLYRATHNEIIDEARKRRHRQWPEDPGSGFGPVETATPERRAVVEEERRLDNAALANFERALAQAKLSDRDRELIELFVCRGLAWEHVAARLELSSGAARTAMSRARTLLLPQLLGSLRPRLREVDWRILDLTMIQRRPPQEVASEVGLDSEEVMDRFMLEVVPAIDRAFGQHGMAMLRRLLHKPAKPARSGERDS